MDDVDDEVPEAQPDPLQAEDDPDLVRRGITDKLIKTMRVEFNRYNKNSQSTLEQALRARDNHQRIFWEVYSGSGNLSAGWLVQRFDFTTGWGCAAELSPNFKMKYVLTLYSMRFSVRNGLPCRTATFTMRREALEAERIYQEKVHLKLCRRSYESKRTKAVMEPLNGFGLPSARKPKHGQAYLAMHVG